ncbi:pentapeptide repeat-containing protein [Kitasatospora aureofaciens]|uniref:pentapeptide repeat-containing protein n=1 Tax=Kitasatospora aureofaciens TaxID=1894 RepID=UPI0033CAAE31
MLETELPERPLSTPSATPIPSKRRRAVITRRGALVVGVTVFLIAFVGLFWKGPELIDGITPAHLGKDDGPKATDVAGLRTALVAGLVGMVGIGTLWLTTATYFTNRAKDREQFKLAQGQFEFAQKTQKQNHTRAQEQFKLAQKQFKLAQETQLTNRTKDDAKALLDREGQITDRYVKAVGLLDSTSVTSRMAGIYALDRIMHDSDKDHATIVQLLAGFIRHHASKTGPWDPFDPPEVPANRDKVGDDVQAALTVLGKRPQRLEEFQIDLTNTYLRGAFLVGARLEGAIFNSADLTGVDLTGAHLAKANFYRARLSAVIASGADLTSTHMSNTYLTGDFVRATLDKSNLERAHIWADLRNATLSDANLAYARLADDIDERKSEVEPSQLLNATVISGTQLPMHLHTDADLTKHIAECDTRWLN